MITGIGVLGVLAGSLASFFRLAPEDHSPTRGATATTAAGAASDATAQLDELKAEVSRLADEIAELRQSQP